MAKTELQLLKEKTAEIQKAYDAVVKTNEAQKVELGNAKNEVISLKEQLKTAKADLKTAQESDSSAELEALKAKNAELEALKEKNPAAKLVTEGTFKIPSGKNKGTYRFKDGFVKTRTKNGDLISSADALEDKELMIHLISIGYAGLELVK